MPVVDAQLVTTFRPPRWLRWVMYAYLPVSVGFCLFGLAFPFVELGPNVSIGERWFLVVIFVCVGTSGCFINWRIARAKIEFRPSDMAFTQGVRILTLPYSAIQEFTAKRLQRLVGGAGVVRIHADGSEREISYFQFVSEMRAVRVAEAMNAELERRRRQAPK